MKSAVQACSLLLGSWAHGRTPPQAYGITCRASMCLETTHLGHREAADWLSDIMIKGVQLGVLLLTPSHSPESKWDARDHRHKRNIAITWLGQELTWVWVLLMLQVRVGNPPWSHTLSSPGPVTEFSGASSIDPGHPVISLCICVPRAARVGERFLDLLSIRTLPMVLM